MTTREGETMNLCKDCKYYHPRPVGLAQCTAHTTVSPVDGSAVMRSPYFERAAGSGHCGEAGEWFAPRESEIATLEDVC